MFTYVSAFGIILITACPLAAQSAQLFSDSFENGLAGWEIYGTGGVSLVPSGDPVHGQVLALRPNGDVHALIRGSGRWGSVRFEGEMLFPTPRNNYLGFIYNFSRERSRMDFGNIYVKGNGSYLQVNPHRDYNVSRTLYSEMTVPLSGRDSIRIGEWAPFRIEVIGSECHVYVGDMDTPKIVFNDLELNAGALGLQPRSVGDAVWVDNVQVTTIQRFHYTGPPIPRNVYQPEELLTDWEVLGPLGRTVDDAARGVGSYSWRPFPADRRGAVVTGRIVDSHGPLTVAYFRTRIRSDRDREAILHFSTIDDLAIWVNGQFHWFMDRGRRAWPDFWRDPAHTGQRIPIELTPGENHIVIRVRGGVYATGGFFVRLEDPDAND